MKFIKNNLIEYCKNIKLSNTLNNIVFNKITDFNELHLFDDIHFISETILNYIHNDLKYIYIFNNDKYNIKIYLPNNSNPENKNLIYKIHSILNYIIDITKTNEVINVFIYLTPIKKEFNKNKDFNHEAFNTGFTNGQMICIFREEEVLKVLIHELVHYLNLENHFDDINNKKLLNYFNMCKDCKINTNEAYTELIAIILFLIWYNKYYFDQFNYNRFNKMLNNELKFSINQSAKCLSIIGCVNKFSDIIDKSNNCKIIQSTSFLSYFVIKTAIMFNIDLFFEFLKINNSEYTLNFNLIQNNIIKFYNLIIKCIEDSNFIKIMNYYIKLNKNKKLNYFNRFTKYA